MMGISIESMTGASCLLYAVSGALGVAAVVLFFLFDIRKCWRMVSGKQKTCTTAVSKDAQTERLSGFPMETVLLCSEAGSGYGQVQETVLLDKE